MKKSVVTLLPILFMLAGGHAHAFTAAPTLSCQSSNSKAPELSVKCTISDDGVGTTVQCSANGEELTEIRHNKEFIGYLGDEAIQITLSNVDNIPALSAKAVVGDFSYDCR